MSDDNARPLSPRQELLLRLVVEAHIESGLPVGSKSLVQAGLVEASSSTVRAELAELEDRGMLDHPHTSAGRVPTEAGYRRYAAEPFVRIYNPGHVPDLHAVAHTNFCDIGVSFDPRTGRTVVVAAIDNLVKGAAGQAVQNMNLMLGYPEVESLL